MRHLKGRLFFNSLLLIIVLFVFNACKGEVDLDLDQIPIESKLQRFDLAFFESDTNQFEAELERLREQYPPFFSSKSEAIFWQNQRRDPLQLELHEQVQKVFGNMEPYEAELSNILKRYYYYFGVRDTVEAYAYISRLDFNFPVVFSPPYLFLATDLYLGESAQKYYEVLPQYLQFERQASFLLRDAAYAIAERMVPKPQDPIKLLDGMIYHGKVLWLTKKLYPALEEATLMKYPRPKFDFSVEHEKEMWVYFIENELLFKADQELQRRFLEVAPFSKFRTQIDQETPGKIGHWFGYKIFSAYAEEAEALDLKTLLQEMDGRKVLKLSGYKP